MSDPADLRATPGGSAAAVPPEAEADRASTPPADLAQIERELAAVDHALARLDDGSYGRCAICDAALDDGVLEADPTASVCPAHLPVDATHL